jgi:hypothetical protein
MKLYPVTIDIGIEFDTAQFDWWKPIGRAWCIGAAGISVLYGARVGVLGLQLVASIEFYDPDVLDADDRVRAGVDVDEGGE